MSPTDEASVLLRRLAEPAPAGAHIETLIRGVSRRLNMSFSRARDLWYGNARRVDSDEMDALRKAVANKMGGKDDELQRRCYQLETELEFLRLRLAQESAERHR